MDKFPEKKNLQKLNHEKIENLSRTTIKKEDESVVKKPLNEQL